MLETINRGAATRRRGQAETAVVIALFAVGLAVRLTRLDLMSFRFDSAVELMRARETLFLGHPPLSGIINSQGFRNPAGFTWFLQPATMLTMDPRAAAAWVGVAALSGLVPLWLTARRWLGSAAALFVGVLWAVAPAAVFSGRAIWAQNLMPAFGAWALWFVLCVNDDTLSPVRRGRAVVGAAVAVTLATLVHLSGAALAFAAAALCARPFLCGRVGRKHAFAALAVGILGAVALLPCAVDYAGRKSAPSLTKPEYETKYETYLAPPDPTGRRVFAAFGCVFAQLSSNSASGGVGAAVDAPWRGLAQTADALLFVLAAVGVMRCALILYRRTRAGKAVPPPNPEESGTYEEPPSDLAHPPQAQPVPPVALALALLSWCFLPPLVGGLIISRPNPTYFAGLFPAILLLAAAALAPAPPSRWTARLAGRALAVAAPLLGACYVTFLAACLTRVDTERWIGDSYYIPLADQAELAAKLSAAGVAPGRLLQLNGDWFQVPTDYTLQWMWTSLHRSGAPLPITPRWAVADDSRLRGDQQARCRFMEDRSAFSVGPVRVAVFRDQEQGVDFAKEFFAIPKEGGE